MGVLWELHIIAICVLATAPLDEPRQEQNLCGIVPLLVREFTSHPQNIQQYGGETATVWNPCQCADVPGGHSSKHAACFEVSRPFVLCPRHGCCSNSGRCREEDHTCPYPGYPQQSFPTGMSTQSSSSHTRAGVQCGARCVEVPVRMSATAARSQTRQLRSSTARVCLSDGKAEGNSVQFPPPRSCPAHSSSTDVRSTHLALT